MIWVGMGNCTTAAIEQELRANVAELHRFEADPQEAFLIVRARR